MRPRRESANSTSRLLRCSSLLFSALVASSWQITSAQVNLWHASIANCGKSSEASEPPTTAASPAAASVALRGDFDSVRTTSFPELASKVVGTRPFASSVDYFRTRFSVSRFLLLERMHYFVEMNPRLATGRPSEESVCAILAHELVHIKRMSETNRLQLLGLVRLASAGYTARFERAADLEAIRRGYGPGLSTYREWVYRNIPAKELKQKKRNYFSPEEIAAILRISNQHPEAFEYWQKHIPLNLRQINEADTNSRHR